jgi:DNA-directed RNA polymerase subunit RPC12/RpoP
MPQTFDCPKCGAPVAFERPGDPNNNKSTLRCAYCHSHLIAPDALAGQPARVVHINLGLSSGKFPKSLWLLVAIPVIVLVVIGLAAFGILAPAFYSVSRAVSNSNNTVPSKPNTPKKESSNSFAAELLKFGSEGIGPGMFTDARSIAVDGGGRMMSANTAAGAFRSSTLPASL